MLVSHVLETDTEGSRHILRRRDWWKRNGFTGVIYSVLGWIHRKQILTQRLVCKWFNKKVLPGETNRGVETPRQGRGWS